MAKDTDYNIDEVIETFRRDGSLIREKARVLTEEGLEELYRRMKDGDLPTSTFLDLMKYLAEIGDLKPKQNNTPQQTGPGFSITINIPQEGKPPITIEGVATDVPSEPLDASDGVRGGMLSGPDLGSIPIHQLGKSFAANSDLTGDGDD